MISILLADDHPLILHGVEELLSGEEDMRVVGKVGDPAEIVDAVNRLQPDVLIQDLSMQGTLSGLEAISAVAAARPATAVVVLSMHSSCTSVCEALLAGAQGYVCKLSDFEELVAAVRSVCAGQRYLGQSFDTAEIDDCLAGMKNNGVSSVSTLTRRELQVLSLVAQGMTSNEIAEDLNIGRRTVESHRANASAKLGLKNQAELVRFAIERGLLGN